MSLQFPLSKNPMQFVGCYVMHLYCDRVNPDHGWKEFPCEITGNNFSQACAKAVLSGWVLHADNTTTCPKCSGVKRR